MPFVSAVSRTVYVVRWEVPTAEDVRAVIAEAMRAYQRAKAKITFIAQVPPDGETPEPAARSAMIAEMKDLIEISDSIHLVFEGAGFKQSIKRSVLAGILLASGKRGHVFVHGSTEDAVLQLAPDLRDTARSILRSIEVRAV
jgi:hypothetical protein